MDISLISNQPVFGRCDRFAEHQVFWILVTFFQGLLAWNTILVSVTQFLVISRKRLVTLSGILAVITVLTVCAIPWALLNLSVVFANGIKVRGSLCTFIPDVVFVIIFPIYFVVFYVTMVVFVVIVSVFVWRKVKQYVIETDAKVIRSVVLLTALMITSTFLCRTPTLLPYTLQVVNNHVFRFCATIFLSSTTLSTYF